MEVVGTNRRRQRQYSLGEIRNQRITSGRWSSRSTPTTTATTHNRWYINRYGQTQRWTRLFGTNHKQSEPNATNNHPVVSLPTSNLPSTSSPNLSPSRHPHIDESDHSVEAGGGHGRTQSAGEFLPDRMSNHPPLDLVVHPHPQIPTSSSTNKTTPIFLSYPILASRKMDGSQITEN